MNSLMQVQVQPIKPRIQTTLGLVETWIDDSCAGILFEGALIPPLL